MIQKCICKFVNFELKWAIHEICIWVELHAKFKGKVELSLSLQPYLKYELLFIFPIRVEIFQQTSYLDLQKGFSYPPDPPLSKPQPFSWSSYSSVNVFGNLIQTSCFVVTKWWIYLKWAKFYTLYKVNKVLDFVRSFKSLFGLELL